MNSTTKRAPNDTTECWNTYFELPQVRAFPCNFKFACGGRIGANVKYYQASSKCCKNDAINIYC